MRHLSPFFRTLTLSALACAAFAALLPTANTASGPVVGIQTAYDGTAFLGIPFARALRWGPPRPPSPWTAPLNASSFASGCITFDGEHTSSADESEDCLTVNVYVPSPAAQTKGRPVLIWVHGGGFVGGNADADFSLLANGTGAVVISISYRLGSLGFLALDGFAPAYPTPTAADAACANVGLLDQQAGLLWAQANAAAFGGDPTHTLLTGQSAGGSSVLFALTLNASYSTYRAALAQSPGSPTNTLAAGRATAANIAARLGCGAGGGFAAQLACLRAATPTAIQAAALAAANTSYLPLTLGPVIDGALVTASPATNILAGNFNRNATVLVSETLFEGDSLLDGFTRSVVLTPAEASAALTQFGVQVGFDAANTASVGAAYAPIAARDGAFNGSSRIWGDGLIGCATTWAARGAAAYSHQPTWRFLFNTTLPGEPAGRATHNTDNAVIHGGAVPALARDIWTWLANVALTGDVNVGPLTASRTWNPYAPGSDVAILVANEQSEYATLQKWQEEHCDALWLLILP